MDNDDDYTGWAYTLEDTDRARAHRSSYDQARRNSPTIDVPRSWWDDPAIRIEIQNTVEMASADYKWYDEPIPCHDPISDENGEYITVARHQNL